METIKVNMNPNPLDVQTIHASQNDGEARQWGFKLHNNGELIDTSEITEQMFFKTYKGGTEQLLPENGSTPTTSPFKGDIRYPQGLLADQEFTYRQSPTESDGYAKITDIKGNTLKWNQLFKIYSPTTVTTNGVTLVTNADGTVTLNGTATARTAFVLTAVATSNGLLTSNHIYYMVVCPKGGNPNTYFGGVAGLVIDTGNGGIWKYNYTWDSSSLRIDIFEGVTFNNVSFKPQYIDLTLLFGAEKAEEILAMGQAGGITYFRSLFPLSYYDFNQGSLLSFMGNGIKTVGKNLVFKTILNSSINGSGVIISTSNFQMSVAHVIKGKEYVITTNDNSKKVLGFYYEEPVVGSVSYNGERVDDSSSYTFTSPITGYVAFRSLGGYSTPMLEFGSTATSYEPYTLSTLSLPISTYFPNGMKSVWNAYDELTPMKAITRIGAVDLGSLDWGYSTGGSGRFQSTGIASSVKIPTTDTGGNIKCAKYINGNASQVYSGTAQICIQNGTGQIWIYDPSFNGDTSAFKTAMSGQYLYYELATPTETSFTTASLVTENTEIPLSNEDGTLIGKCTEELSAEPGFHDAKIKLTDSDGECYSNKIQLHIERSPQ